MQRPPVVTGDINLDPGCLQVTDPDMAIGSSPGPEDIMALSDKIGHSDQQSSGSPTALRHSHSLKRLQLHASVWPLVVTGATNHTQTFTASLELWLKP